MNARSVPGFALTTAPILKVLFTNRDTAITVNSVKEKSRSRPNEFSSLSYDRLSQQQLSLALIGCERIF